MSFTLTPLKYATNALSPLISKEQVEDHYNRVAATYVMELNRLVMGTPMAKMSLVELIRTQKGEIYNNAAQVWNHEFTLNGLKPGGSQTGGKITGMIGAMAGTMIGNKPGGKLREAIDLNFGSFDAFYDQFTQAAMTHFGSGYIWLAKDTTATPKLKIMSMHDAGNPLSMNMIPVMGVDVWEHAYYIDTRNDKQKYLTAIWHSMDWDEAEKQFTRLPY